jgi:acyl-homoserine-lactone acylase
VLHDWDGRSERSSRGTHIFEEFVARLPDQGVWRTPFDPAEPLTTPRDLNTLNPLVRQAMADAIDSLRQRGIPFDATWGSLQVAGDRGASPIPLGGGTGAAVSGDLERTPRRVERDPPLGGGTGDSVGNANALASRWPEDNTDRYRPITYGSSHIQAISFLAGGGVDARTILTYGQSEDPTSPWSEDQTRIYGNGEWVHFPWTDEQLAQHTVSEYTVSSP